VTTSSEGALSSSINRFPFTFLTRSLHSEISNSRAQAWKVITFRHHKIERVFAGDPEGKDLILVGKLEARTKNESDRTTITEFAGRLLVEETAEGKAKLSSYQAFIGTSNTTK